MKRSKYSYVWKKRTWKTFKTSSSSDYILVHKWLPAKENLKTQMRADLLKEPLAFVCQHLAKQYCSVRIQNGLQEHTGGIALHDVHTNIRPQYKVVGKSD